MSLESLKLINMIKNQIQLVKIEHDSLQGQILEKQEPIS